MNFLRRRSTEAETSAPHLLEGEDAQGSMAAAESQTRGHTPGKGRPTPKRRDAGGRRRGPAPPPPKTQREAIKLARRNRANRSERRKQAADQRARMKRGDDSALPTRDKGPVKAFVRDAVDARRHLMGLFLPLAGLVFLSLVLPIPQIQQYISVFCMAMMAAMILEGALLGRRVVKQARERFPKEQISGPGLGWYTFARASQLRKLRVPKPRVDVGASI